MPRQCGLRLDAGSSDPSAQLLAGGGQGHAAGGQGSAGGGRPDSKESRSCGHIAGRADPAPQRPGTAWLLEGFMRAVVLMLGAWTGPEDPRTGRPFPCPFVVSAGGEQDPAAASAPAQTEQTPWI